MKLRKNIASVLLAGAIGLSVAGCLHDNTENCPAPGFDPSGGKAIKFGASVGTRAFPGHPIENGANNIPVGTSFGVYAYHLPENETDVTAFAELQNAAVTRNTDGTFTYSPVAMWPSNTNDKLGFWAYFPWVDTSSPDHPMTVTMGSGEQSMSIAYTVPANPAEQVDVMYARSGMKTGYETVSLNFRHALTRLRFEGKLKDFATGVTAKVTGITMSGSVTNGELVMLDPVDQANPWWELGTQSADVAMTASNGLKNANLTTSLTGILAGGGDMLMLPQEVDGIEMAVEVTFGTETQTYTFPLDGTVDWLMNEIVTYEIVVSPTGIEVSASADEWDDAPQGIIFDGQYKLEVSHPAVTFDISSGSVEIDITTDYDRTDRGFDAGAFIDFPDDFPTWLTVKTDGGAATSTEDGELARTIKITATANDAVGTVDRDASFTVRAGNMNYVLNVTQTNKPWLTYRSLGALMDGQVWSIPVSSDFKWTCEIVESTNALTEGGKAVPNLLTTRGGGVQNEEVLFSTYNDRAGIMAGTPTRTHKFVTFRFSDPDGVLPSKEFPVLIASGDIQPYEANSYMVSNASLDGSSTFKRAILIPVSRANNPRLQQIPSLAAESWPRIAGAFDAEMVWNTQPTGIDLQSNISRIKDVDYGKGGYIAIIPGLLDGNVLTAATVNDVIKWSWHIWVTGDRDLIEQGAGTDNRWMDRNIGALINYYDANKTPDCNGFLFQFGRKDLFTSSKSHILYDMEGITYTHPTHSSSQITVAQAIADPNIFAYDSGYTWTSEGCGSGYAWYDLSSTYSDKSIFDPCPPGWKIPLKTDWIDSSSWTTYTNYYVCDEMGGVYPGVPKRSGTLFNNSNNDYWTSRASSTTSGYIWRLPDNSRSSGLLSSYANPIRCVRHTEE